MCGNCSSVYIPNKIAVENSKNNFEECEKHILVRFTPDFSVDYDIVDLKEIQDNVQRNYVYYMKQFYLYKLSDPDCGVYPFDIHYPDETVCRSMRPKTHIEKLLMCGFIAHTNLRKVIYNYRVQMEEIQNKKRQRRTRHKKNKKEKRAAELKARAAE
jgi:hypothetical protein